MSKKDLIATAEAILASGILTKQDGTPTKGGRKMSRHLTFVTNGTGDTKYHRERLEGVVTRTMDFYEITVS